MKEQGIVSEIKGDRATVRVSYSESCEKCGMCLKKNGFMEVSALNPVNAAVGDEVKVETKKEMKFTSITLSFLIPLILLVAGIVAGYFMKSEILMLVFALIPVIIWYVILSFIDKKFFDKKDFCPTITEILKEKDNG